MRNTPRRRRLPILLLAAADVHLLIQGYPVDEVKRSKRRENGTTVVTDRVVKVAPPYPINSLRNLAILGAEKRQHDSWIFVLDADAKPSNNMSDAVQQLTMALAYGDGPPAHSEWGAGVQGLRFTGVRQPRSTSFLVRPRLTPPTHTHTAPHSHVLPQDGLRCSCVCAGAPETVGAA